DDLEATLLLEPAKGGDEICVDSPEQLPQTGEPRPPVVYEWHERPIAGRLQRRGRFVAGGQPLREERLQFAGEGGARKLVRQHRQVGVQRGLAQPVAAVGPAAVIEDVRQMTVEGEDELHRVPGQLEREADRTARARPYSAKYCSPERCQPNC